MQYLGEFTGRRIGMAQKRVSDVDPLVEFLNEEVKAVSKRLSLGHSP